MISHPEGGHYVENFKNENVSQIYYLLKRNEKSHWHRLTKNEIFSELEISSSVTYETEESAFSTKDSHPQKNIKIKVVTIIFFMIRTLY